MKLTTARKRLLPLAVAALLLLLVVPAAQAWPFGDVPVGHWAYNAIRRIAYLHITAGCGGGNYCPDDYVTRAQMAGFMNNLTKAWTDQDEPYIISVDHQYQANNRPAIVGRSKGGSGLEGYSYGGSAADHGVYGNTNSTQSGDAGVFGDSTDNASGVYGRNTDTDTFTTTSYGVRAYSAQGHGVYSDGGSGWDDYGGYFRGYHGVRAEATGGGVGIQATSSTGPAGLFVATSFSGVRAFADGLYHDGVEGTSDDRYGVRGETNVVNGYGLYTSDRIYTGGGCVGCTSMLIAQNGGDTPLEPGDVVAVVGIATGPSESYARPVLLVRQADGTSSQGVVGVVEGRYVIKKGEREEVELTTRLVEIPDPEGKEKPDVIAVEDRTVKKVPVEAAHATTEPAGPGELLTIVYRGIAQVKADAASGAIQVGDLLASASASGRATKAVAAEGGAVPSGTIIGKALEPLAKGQGLIWVLVDLQ